MTFNRASRFRYRTPVEPRIHPPSLSDHQLEVVTAACRSLGPTKRNEFLSRVMAALARRGRYFDDSDFDVVVRQALAGLLHSAPAA